MLFLTMMFAYWWQYSEKQLANSTSQGRLTKKKCMNLGLAVICTFLPMYLVNASISYVGNDYINYHTYFKNIASGRGQDVEIGYKLINIIVIKLGLDFQWVYFITCFIAYAILMLCIKKYSKNYALSYLLFFVGGSFFMLGLNQIRQFVALGCVMLALQYIEKRQLIKYSVLIILGGLFHVTAFVMLPFYFILNKKIKLSTYVVGGLLILPINLFFNEIMVWLFKNFMPRYLNSNYISREYKLEIPYLIMIVFTTFIVLFFLNKKEELEGMDRIYLNGCMISLLIATVGTWVPEYKRFIYYFFIPLMFFIPNCIQKEKKLWLKLGMILIVVVVNWIYVSSTIGYSNVLPYKSFF